MRELLRLATLLILLTIIAPLTAYAALQAYGAYVVTHDTGALWLCWLFGVLSVVALGVVTSATDKRAEATPTPLGDPA